MGCVTSKIYNDRHYNWEKVQRHLQGIWHNSNSSLDILILHSEIINLKNAALQSFGAVDTADKIIHGLRSVFPSLSSFENGLYSLTMLALLLLLLLLFFIKIYLSHVYEYTVAVFRHTRRGHQISLRMVVSHHMIAGI